MFPAQKSLSERGVVAGTLSALGGTTRALITSCAGLGILFWLSGCQCDKEVTSHAPDERDPVTGLTQDEAKEVLVTVGNRAITLGDYVATLSRMDQFERLRYQTEDRQKALLDEMIEIEVLAQEAERRGLDKDPEVQLRLQQALRDELLRLIEAKLPAPEEISEREVRAYYDAHRSEFKEPERRRVLLIKVGSEAVAQEVLKEAQAATGEEWAKLARKYSLEHATAREGDPEEFAGDVGFVSPPGEQRGANNAVPDDARAAVFELKKVGDVLSRAVTEGKYFYIVRLGGISPARDRTVSEADRAIRIELRRLMFLQAEKDLEAELRNKYPVKIDEQAILNFHASNSKGAPPPSAPSTLPEKKQ